MSAKQLLVGAGLSRKFWGRRIIAAEKRGVFTINDRRLAWSWQTCACGRQDPRIPRYKCGEPRDLPLSILGSSFYAYVNNNLFIPAAKALIDIEKRAGELLEVQR